MIYLKTLAICLLVSLFFSCGIFISYSDIKLANLLYLFIPILVCGVAYYLFQQSKKNRVDFQLIHLKMHFGVSLFLVVVAAIFSSLKLNINDLLNSNYASIREDFLERDVSLLDQLIPLMVVYPFAHMLFLFSKNTRWADAKAVLLVVVITFISLSYGGRQTIFQIFILLLGIKGRVVFSKWYYLLFIGLFISLAAVITAGRFENEDVNKAVLIENVSPANISESIKDNGDNQNLYDILIETSFYFGHQIPAFCNKIANLNVQVLPTYPLAMQPFIERQVLKTGFFPYTQTDRYETFINLAHGSGFFEVSWSTGFLDVYYNLGYLGCFVFFLLIAFLLHTTQTNLDKGNTSKYLLLQAFNILFIITMFMTPAFLDTTIFFAYTLIFFNKLS